MRPSADVLAALFENAPRFVARLTDEEVSSYVELLERAEQMASQLPADEKLELVDGHPRIGAAPGTVSATSFHEQGYDRSPADADTNLVERLERLNDEYERRFGFRFCIFVAGRSRAAIADIMESRLRAVREEEMQRALAEVFMIARSRLEKLPKPLEVAR